MECLSSPNTSRFVYPTTHPRFRIIACARDPTPRCLARQRLTQHGSARPPRVQMGLTRGSGTVCGGGITSPSDVTPSGHLASRCLDRVLGQNMLKYPPGVSTSEAPTCSVHPTSERPNIVRSALTPPRSDAFTVRARTHTRTHARWHDLADRPKFRNEKCQTKTTKIKKKDHHRSWWSSHPSFFFLFLFGRVVFPLGAFQ